MAQHGAERVIPEVPLGEVVVETGCRELIKDLDGSVILLLLGREEADLKQALVCALDAVLSFVEISSLLVTVRR